MYMNTFLGVLFFLSCLAISAYNIELEKVNTRLDALVRDVCVVQTGVEEYVINGGAYYCRNKRGDLEAMKRGAPTITRR